jgi:hypothetical protein
MTVIEPPSVEPIEGAQTFLPLFSSATLLLCASLPNNAG